MKKHIQKALAALAILGATSQVNAYSYIFSNHTNKEIGVAMRYHGLGEPRYFRWIPAHESRQFTPRTPNVDRGNGIVEAGIEDRKIGFVAKTFWYVENPTVAQKQNAKEALAWHEFQITWLPTESYNIAMKLYEAAVATTIANAKFALDAALAYASGGTSAGAGAGAGAAGGAAGDAINKALETAKGGDMPKAFHELLMAVGQAGARSMMIDRHIDIVEDEGKIKFISQL